MTENAPVIYAVEGHVALVTLNRPEKRNALNDELVGGLKEALRATSRPGTFSDTDIAVYKAAAREPGALTGAINYYRANFRSFFGRRFGDTGIKSRERVRVPTLFVYGERDFGILPETVAGVADYVDAPYTELRLGRSNHWVQQESPAEVNAALLSFLEE